MADRKISDLTALTAQASGDLLPIVDVSEAAAADKNKSITIQELFRGIPVNVGVGTASPASILHLSGSSDQTYTLQTTTSGADNRINFRNSSGTDAGGIWYMHAGNHLLFNTGGSNQEKVRIDSSGRVGIGTTSPGHLLDVVGSNAAVKVSEPSGAELRIAAGGSLGYFGTYSNHPLQILTNSQNAVRIDSSGNVGIGTTSPSRKLDIAAGQANVGITSNTTSAGNEPTLVFTHAGNNGYVIKGGSNLQFASDSGTNVRMTLTTAGSLGIGTTSPGSFNASANNLVVGTGSGNEGITIYGGSDSQSRIDFKDSADTTETGILYYAHSSDAMIVHTAGTERARIDSSGRLLVGTSSAPSSSVQSHYGKLIVSGNSANNNHAYAAFITGYTAATQGPEVSRFVFGNTDAEYARIDVALDGTAASGSAPGRMVFYTTASGASSPTERMRITSEGLFKFSNTGAYGSIDSGAHGFRQGTSGNWTLEAVHAATSGNVYGIHSQFPSYAPNNTSSWFYNASDSSVNRFTVYSNGGIANYQSNNVNLCDEREKKNIETLDSTWGCLKNWDLKKFHYNEDADTDDKRYGVIAQQVAEHCPEVITDWVKQKAEDAVLDEDGNVVTPAQEEVTRMAVKEQQMMWMAIKALQEAQTRIETLEAEVAALKGA